jgi:type 1 fimbriae regulatory protein FimB/type 1 fimbriae regulatory protein FimE
MGSSACFSGWTPADLKALKPHPYMLRHSCGYKLANDDEPNLDMRDHLGHVNIQNTVQYTQLSPGRSKKYRW